MPTQTQTPFEAGTRAEADPDGARATADGPASGLSLLADPRTIAGADTGDAVATSEANDGETPTAAPRTEADATQPGETPALVSTPIPTAENPVPHRPLMDAASARRLAADARRRQRECREALEAAREAREAELRATFSALPEQTATASADPLDTSTAGAPSVAVVAEAPIPSPSSDRIEPDPGTTSTARRVTEPTTRSAPESSDDPAEESSSLAISAAEASTPPSDTRPVERSTPPPSVELADRSTSLTDAAPERGSTRAPEHSPGWQRRALAPSRSLRPDGPPPGDTERALATARAELREVEATLALARETTAGQRRTIATLRAELADRPEPTPRSPETASLLDADEALEAARRENDRLREELSAQQRMRAREDSERDAQKRRITDQHETIAGLRRELETLRDRFDAQDRALDAARREYTLERQRHSESREVLTRLRETLALEPEQTSAEPLRSAEPIPNTTWAGAAPQIVAERDETPRRDRSETIAAGPIVSSEPLPAAPSEGRAPIFERWQDDQIRRQFGPMGIDCFLDLVRTALARQTSARVTPGPVLLVGRGALSYAPMLAEGLIAGGVDGFRVLVADPSTPIVGPHTDALPLAPDSPLRAALEVVPFALEGVTAGALDGVTAGAVESVTAGAVDDDSTGEVALDALIQEHRPAVIVCRDLLSTIAEVEPWLAVLERAAAAGTSLVFSERTGAEASAPHASLSTIGERIWARMPMRYTRDPSSETVLGGWSDAFLASSAESGNDLRQALRLRFRPEMWSQFGYLAEPFVSSPVAANFDPEAPRDLRFLAQVAELDERKIEAGEAEALHLVALVVPPSED